MILISKDSSKLVLTKVKTALWGAGFCENLKITNNGNKDVEWDIATAIEGEIYDLWNASYTQGGMI